MSASAIIAIARVGRSARARASTSNSASSAASCLQPAARGGWSGRSPSSVLAIDVLRAATGR
jgi:hypothetical protein